MGANERALTPTMVAASKRGDFALRFYVQGDGTSNLLCMMPGIECPQWYYTMDYRYTFASPPEALAFLGVIRSDWPEFLGQDGARGARHTCAGGGVRRSHVPGGWV